MDGSVGGIYNIMCLALDNGHLYIYIHVLSGEL